jgi:DoxX-like family
MMVAADYVRGMNQQAMMESSSNTSKTLLWLGIGLTALLVLFLAADGIAKVIRVSKVLEANQKLGLAPELVPGFGILLLVCTALYAYPKTAILGAILLTGYLGGATAVHVIARSGTFPIAFSVTFGALAWVGLALREPRLVRWVLLHQ